MLERSISGCEGPSVLQPRFIEIECMKTPFGFGGSARVLDATNPNPKPGLPTYN